MGDTDMPGCRVEVAWTTPPRTRPADADFTRIDGHVPLRSLTTKRGGRVKVPEIEAGDATAVFDNRSRDLDPSNVSSAWAPNVKPRRRIRYVIEPADGSAERKLHTGFIERLPIGWEVGDGWAEVTSVDLLGLIAGDTLPPSVLHATIVDSAPVAYWPLTETSGTTVDDVVGTADGELRVPLDDAAEVVPYAAGGKLFSVYSQEDKVTPTISVDPFDGGSTWAVVVWFRADTNYPLDLSGGGTVYDFNLFDHRSATDNAVTVWVDTTLTNRGRVQVLAGDSTNYRWRASAEGLNVLDGQPHCFVAQSDGTSVKLWVDGVEASAQLGTGGTFPAAVGRAPIRMGNNPGFEGVPDAASPEPARWRQGHVAYWNRALTDQEIADIYAAGASAWADDRTDVRLGRILDTLGVDAGDRDIEPGTAYCGPTRLDGANALEYLRKIVATEPGGSLWVNGDGQIAFRPGVANDPAPAATFVGDPDVDAGTPYTDLVPDYSLDRIVNVADVTRENAVTQRTTNDDSIDEYGPLGVELETLHRTASGARGAGARLTNRYRDPRLVFSGLELNSRRDDVPPTDSLDLEVNDPVEVMARPTGGGAPIQQLSAVERVEHALDWRDKTWSTVVGLAEHIVLPLFEWDTVGQGWDQSVWPAT